MTQIFFLAGPPAVGKSSTARALAAQFQKSIHIPVDNLRDMVVSGLALPSKEWSQELIEQLALARESASQMAIAYNKAGFVVAIDDFWDPNTKLGEYSLLFQEENLHKVLLFPGQRVAEERNLRRSGPGEASKYIAEGIRTIYEVLQEDIPNLENQGWMIVDTSNLTVEAAVQQILLQTENRR